MYHNTYTRILFYQVDFVLLGGDLFHENKPSRRTLNRTMELLRKYVQGDKPIQFRMLGNPESCLSGFRKGTNFEDENMNIELPIFSIHGNHDDPTGEGLLSPLDLLATSGLLNYFGRSNTVDSVEIKPLLIQKGKTRVALYGLGHIHDERLFRLFRDDKVTWYRPEGTVENSDS